MTNGGENRQKTFVFLAFSLIFCLISAAKAAEQTPDWSEELEKTVPASFLQLYKTIKTSYRQPLEDRKLLVAALKGMLGELDPYSRYLDTQEMKSLMERTDGSSLGVGLELGLEGDQVVVSGVAPEGPADKAGLFEGLLLQKVNGKVVDKKYPALALKEARVALEGKEGSQVTLHLLDPFTKKSKSYVLKRKSVPGYQSFAFQHPEGRGVCVWVLTHLSANSPELSARELARPELKSCTSWILDLRDNEGGDLEGTRGLLSHYYPKGESLYHFERGPQATRESITSLGLTPKFPLPDLIMVNEKTASGAELIAQNLAREKGVLVGGPNTVGKALVQQIFTLVGGDGFTLTVGRYTDLAGTSVMGQGVRPTVMVAWPKANRPSEDFRKVARGLLPFLTGTPPSLPPDTSDSFWNKVDAWLLNRGIPFVRQDSQARFGLWRAVRRVWFERRGLPHFARQVQAEEDVALSTAGGMVWVMSQSPLNQEGFRFKATQMPAAGACKDFSQDTVCLLYALGLVAKQGDQYPEVLEEVLHAMHQLDQSEAIWRLLDRLDKKIGPDFFLTQKRAEPVIESGLKLREADRADKILRPLLASGEATAPLLYWDGVIGLLKMDLKRLDKAMDQLAALKKEGLELYLSLGLTAGKELKSKDRLADAVRIFSRLPVENLSPQAALELRMVLLENAKSVQDCKEEIKQLEALSQVVIAGQENQVEVWMGDWLKATIRCAPVAKQKAVADYILKHSKDMTVKSLANRVLNP